MGFSTINYDLFMYNQARSWMHYTLVLLLLCEEVVPEGNAENVLFCSLTFLLGESLRTLNPIAKLLINVG